MLLKYKTKLLHCITNALSLVPPFVQYITLPKILVIVIVCHGTKQVKSSVIKI